MIVNRRVYMVKGDRVNDALALLKKVFAEAAPNYTVRVYVHDFGPQGTIAYEAELENLADYERFMKLAGERITPERWRQWCDCLVPGGTNEAWRLV
jgi:hypothetical protein